MASDVLDIDDPNAEAYADDQEMAPTDDAVATVGEETLLVQQLKERATKKKGRGFNDGAQRSDRERRRGYQDDEEMRGDADPLEPDDDNLVASPSIEGWVIFVSGLHEEAQEDVILDTFSEYGDVKNINMNPDRRTGYIKGYALIEYDTKEEASTAIKNLNGQQVLGRTLRVTWAFAKSASSGDGRRRHRAHR